MFVLDNGWEIALFVMLILNLGFGIALHGKPKEGEHSFGISLLSVAIWFTCLYGAGLFH